MGTSNGCGDRDRWARLRFAVVGPLLASPPPAGRLCAELERLSQQHNQTVMTVEHRAAPGLNDIEIELADDGRGPALRLRRPVPGQSPAGAANR